MTRSWEEYVRQEEFAALSRCVAVVLEALRALDEGRNRDCWPVLSFGGREADLEPDGCTGIQAITGADEGSLTVKIGGHKTVTPRVLDGTSPLGELEQEIVCMFSQYPGDWSGEDWSFHTEQEIQVPWSESGDWDLEDAAATAQAIYDAANAALEPFRQNMRELAEALSDPSLREEEDAD
jgi:hypothetical protein